MARTNLWMGVKNWLKTASAPVKKRSNSHRRWIGLEILEERAVPATIMVTNLLDGTNPTSPLPGSLREAVKVLAKPGDEIQFAPELFTSGNPQSLILNGAVGALQIEQNNISIVGPGKFTTGPNTGTYQLTIQADYGFQDNILVTNGGTGYRVGDMIDQGSTTFLGGARFQVLTIDNPVAGVGAVTSVKVVNPGSNDGFTGTLSASGTGLNNLSPVGSVSGSGLVLAANNGNIALASGLIFTQLVMANPQNFAVSGLHFGDSRSAPIYQNLGNLSVDDCLFNSIVEPVGDQLTDPFGSQVYIQTSNYSGKISVSNSVFDSTSSGVWNHVQQNGNGAILISNSKFTEGHGQVSFNSGGSISIINSEFSLASNYPTNPSQIGFAFKGSGSSLTIADSKFHNGTNGVIFTSSGKAIIDNSYFYKITNGGLTLNGPSTRVTNSFFSNNTRAISGGSNQGGAAIWATGGSLTLRKSIFSDNKIQGIRNFNCGGGAVFNFDGPLTVDGCSFTGNSISVTGFPNPSDPLFNFAPNPELMPSPANSGGGALHSGGSTEITNSYFNQNEMTSTVDFWASTVIQDDGTSSPSRPQFAGGGAIYITSNGGQTTSYELSNLTATENAVRQTGSITNPYVGAGVNAITSEDFDRDGIPDLIIGTTLDANNIEYWKGNGGGKYTRQTPQADFSVLAPIRGMVAGDFNNDNLMDFVVVSYSLNNNVAFFQGRGNGLFTPSFYTAGQKCTSVVAGDLNGSGGLDIVIGCDTNTDNIQVIRDGNFGNPNGIDVRNPNGFTTSVGLGYANLDGDLDLVVGLNQTANNVAVLLGNGNGSFGGSKFSTAGGSSITGVGIGRFDGKGANDVIAINGDSSNNVQIYLDYDNFNPARTGTKWSASSAGTDKSTALIVDDLNADGLDDVIIIQKVAANNAIVGLADSNGALAYSARTAGNTARTITRVPYSNGGSGFAVGCLDIKSNIWINLDPVNNNWSLVGSTSKKQTSGSGLTAGAIMIAAGVDAAVANIIQERPFTGTTKGSIANCTITNNELVNPYALVGQAPLLNSNARSGPLFLNRTDTGGVFVNTPSSSETKVINTILARNIGNVYTTSGSGSVGYSNSGKRFADSNNDPGSFASLGHNLYGAASTFGFNAPDIGDLPRSDSAPVFDLYGLANNLGPAIGLIKPQPALPGQGQGKILTMALDRLSPARDAGSDSVFSSADPVQLNYDGRGVLRKINLAVDIGAYEVQTGTATVVVNPTLLPEDSTHPNPYFVTNYGLTTDITVGVQWNDFLPPSGVISGTVQLVNQSDPTQVIGVGTVVGDPNDVNAGGLATISLNVAGLPPTLLNTGLNNFLLIYSGDPTWAPSQSNPFSVEVIASPTTTTLLAGTPSVQIPGGLITFSGSVTANSIILPQGLITLRARILLGGGDPAGSWSTIANGLVDSVGNFSFNNVKFATPGNYEVQAVYTSTTPSQFTNSTSASVVQEIGYYFTATPPLSAFVVDPITRGATIVSSVERGDLITLQATALFNTADGLPLGTVQFLTPAGTVIGNGIGNLVAPGQMEYTLVNVNPTMLPLGSSQIMASYTRQWTTAGDPYLSMNTLNSQPLTITSIATTTSLTAAPPSLIYGNNLLLTATVSPTKAGVNYQAGTIDFYSGTLKLASVPVTGNSPSATLNTNTLAPGNYSITAVYSGDGLNYSAATSAARSVVVNKAATALGISVTPPATVTIPNQVTITASLTNNAGPGAAKPSGLIYLYRDGVTLANWDLTKSGVPTFTDTPYVAGTYTYELRYTGDVNYLPASPVSQVVQAIVSPVTTTTLQVSAGSTVYGTPLVFTANVAPAAGVAYQSGRKVKFEAWNGPTMVNLGESTLNLNVNGWPLPVEITSAALPAGNWDIKALYEGDGVGGYYLPSTSTPVTVTVAIASTSLSLGIAGTYVDGMSVVPLTLTLENNAQVPPLSPSGSIIVTANGGTISIATIPVTPGTTSYTVNNWIPGAAGTFNLAASYSGDANYQSASTTGQVTTYLKTNTQSAVTTASASSTYGASVTLVTTVSPAGLPAGGQVQFYVNGVVVGALQTLAANQKAILSISTLDVGSQSITARYLGRSPEYLESISPSTVVTVAKAPTSMALTPSSNLGPIGTPLTLTATLSEGVLPPAVDPVGNIEFWANGVLLGNAPIIKGVATYTITPQVAKTSLYEARFTGSGTYLASAASTSVTAYRGALEKYYVTASQAGSGLYIFDRATNLQAAILYPLGTSYTGGFTVTRGDLNDDGVADIVFAARNTGLIQVLDGNDFTLIGSAAPFGAFARFPLSIAVGDIDGDGFGDIIAAPAGIGMPPHVVAVSGKDYRTTLFSQYAYSEKFVGGVSVASGEVNGDKHFDIITAPLVGAPPHIVTFSGLTGAVLQSYYAYDPKYLGGTSITANDLDGDGFTEIITSASAAAPHVVVVEARTQRVRASFYAYDALFGGGVRVTTVQDINNDGVNDIATCPGPGAGPNIVRFDGAKALLNQVVVLDSIFAWSVNNPFANYYGSAFVG